METVYRSSETTPWAKLLLPWHVMRSLTRHGLLVQQLVSHEILARYRGSFLGALWSVLRPLAMLGVYTLVFGFIMQPRLPGQGRGGNIDYVFSLFCGLILFDFFGECLIRAPTLVLSHPNYVKRVVFPLEVLAVAAVGAALVQMAISFLPFLLGLAILHNGIPLAALWLPVIVLPLALFALGLSWLLSSLGVFVRDLNALVPVATTILLFASAVFYSLNQIPIEFRSLFLYNPLALLIDQARNVVLLGLSPGWARIGAAYTASVLFATVGFSFFMRTKRAFADVM